MENKHKHLEFIQKVIDQKSSSVLVLRGVSITLTAILLAIFVFAREATEVSVPILVLMVGLLLIFWFLDGHFLSQTRLFRALYDTVVKRDPNDIDFSMDTDDYRGEKRNGWLSSVLSKTLVVFYMALLVLIVVVVVMSYLLALVDDNSRSFMDLMAWV